MTAQALIQQRLRQKLLEAKIKNPRVSVRSLAKQLSVPAGTLSLVLLGKRPISRKLALKFADALFLDPIERAKIEADFEKKKTLSKSRKEPASDRWKPENLRLSADQFHVMKDWWHYAILNLITTDEFRDDPLWIAARINLEVRVVQEALDRLERLKLLVRDGSGRLKRQHRNLQTTDDIPNLSVRYAHLQNLELARGALERVALDDRDFSWLTLPVDFSRMKEMKLMVREFQDQFLQKFGQEKGANEVLQVCLQLFPLTQIQKKEGKKA
jgi:uncharacterized protein (TIGR02147 family)